MSRTARVAIVQSDHDADDPAENLAAMRDALLRYADRDLVVFPELALHGHHLASEPPGEMRRVLQALPPEASEAFHAAVADAGTRVVFGELVERDGRLLNLATYSDGRVRVSYAKTHVHWSEAFLPGSEFPVVDSPLGRLGMLICFDAAFPEVPRILALQGATVIVNVSAIPDHFPLSVVHRRLQACSVDNQVWTIFANRRGRGFLGGSAVVDPTGDVVAVASADDRALEVTIDVDFADEWRAREPLFTHRRPELYAALTEPVRFPERRASEPATTK